MNLKFHDLSTAYSTDQLELIQRVSFDSLNYLETSLIRYSSIPDEPIKESLGGPLLFQDEFVAF